MQAARLIDSRRILDLVKIRFYNEWLYNTHQIQRTPNEIQIEDIKMAVQQYFAPLQLPLHSRIIDVKCGTGLFLDITRSMNYDNVVGVELNAANIQLCQSRGHTIASNDFHFLPQTENFEDESVDFIWARHALEHSPYPIFALTEMNRLLRFRGKMYIQTPQPDTGNWEDNADVYSVLEQKQLIKLLERTGFTVHKFARHEDEHASTYRLLVEKTQSLDIK